MKFIPLIIFLIIIVSTIRNLFRSLKKQVQKTGEAVSIDSETMPDWQNRLQKILSGETFEEIDTDAPSADFQQTKSKDRDLPPPLPQKESSSPSPQKGIADKSHIVTKEKPSFYMEYDKMKLKKAIIWAEILAPPVGLREKDTTRWI